MSPLPLQCTLLSGVATCTATSRALVARTVVRRGREEERIVLGVKEGEEVWLYERVCEAEEGAEVVAVHSQPTRTQCSTQRSG